jgi:3-mercaptopyruvate sulfurtransferase SseA
MKRGITRVRPLLGGIEEWKDKGFPVITRTVPEPAATSP